MRPFEVDVFPTFGQVVPAFATASVIANELNESKLTRKKNTSNFFMGAVYVI